MASEVKRQTKTRLPILAALAAAIVQGSYLFYIYELYHKQGYLPTPFLSDKHDTFMDLFHTLYWSNDIGRYTEWGSVYPPMVFLALQGVSGLLFGIHVFVDGFEMRAAGGQIAAAFVVTTTIATMAIFATSVYSGMSRIERFGWCLSFILSAPYLFALERGNTIVYVPVLIAWAMIDKAWGRALAIAVMINIKPYCVIFLLAYLCLGEYLWFLRAVAIAGIIFLTTGMLLDPNFPVFITSLLGFSSAGFSFSPNSVLGLDASLTVFSYVQDWNVAVAANFNEFGVERRLFISAALRTINSAIVLAVLTGLFRTRQKWRSEHILAALCVVITNANFSFGSYTLIFYAVALPVLSGLRHGMLLVCLGTLLFAPLDLIIVSHEAVGSQEVYLSGKTVDVTVSLGLGSIFRPIINAFMLLTIAIECWGLDWLQIIRWHSLRMRARMILLKYQQGNP